MPSCKASLRKQWLQIFSPCQTIYCELNDHAFYMWNITWGDPMLKIGYSDIIGLYSINTKLKNDKEDNEDFPSI